MSNVCVFSFSHVTLPAAKIDPESSSCSRNTISDVFNVQIQVWFKNRRAKWRKQRRESVNVGATAGGLQASTAPNGPCYVTAESRSGSAKRVVAPTAPCRSDEVVHCDPAVVDAGLEERDQPAGGSAAVKSRSRCGYREPAEETSDGAELGTCAPVCRRQVTGDRLGTKYEGGDACVASGEWIISKSTDDSVENGSCELSYSRGIHHHRNGCHHGSGLFAGNSGTAASRLEFDRFLVIR